MLSEIKEKVKRSVTVAVSIDNLNTEIMHSILTLSEQFPGKHNLKFVVSDFDEGYTVPLRSKKFKINLDETFILQLKQIPMLEIKIN